MHAWNCHRSMCVNKCHFSRLTRNAHASRFAFDIYLRVDRPCVCVCALVRAKEMRQDSNTYITIISPHIRTQSFPRARANASKHSHTPVKPIRRALMPSLSPILIRISFDTHTHTSVRFLSLLHRVFGRRYVLLWHLDCCGWKNENRTHICNIEFLSDRFSVCVNETVIS